MISLSLRLTFRLVRHGFFLLLLGMGYTPAHAVTLDFAGLNDGPFTEYSKAGFTVSPLAGAWKSFTGYGNPPPFIKFDGGGYDTATVKIIKSNSTFKFASVDLYSSTTPIPYVFAGYLNSQEVFKVTGTIPNTFGNFATATNPKADVVIDTLEITLSNPASCCNPVGLDNVILNSSTDYLDVAALPDVNGNGVMDQAVLVMKGDSYYLQSIDSATGKLIKQALLGTAAAITPKSLASVGQQISILATKGTGASILQIRDSATLVLVKTLTLPK